MADYIKREAVINAFYSGTADGDKAEWCVGIIRSIPVVDVAPVVRGHWISQTAVLGTTTGGTTIYKGYKCSVCGALRGRRDDAYCYRCGADMREVDDA